MPPKEIPQMGPGSKIKALIDALKKNLIIAENKKQKYLIIDFTNIGFKYLPMEICKNEEVCELAAVFFLQFNKLKHLPDNICNLKFLRYMDMRNNNMSFIPAVFFQCIFLEYVSISMQVSVIFLKL